LLVDVTEVAGEVVRYLVPAVTAYGGRVLDKIEEITVGRTGEAATDAAVSLGGRLLGRLIGRAGTRPAVEEAVADLAADPDDADAQAALRVQVKKLLAADEQFAEEIREMLASAGTGSAGNVSQHVVGFDQAQQAVQGHGVQTVTFGSVAERGTNG
jgi:hypothetical protein